MDLNASAAPRTANRPHSSAYMRASLQPPRALVRARSRIPSRASRVDRAIQSRATRDDVNDDEGFFVTKRRERKRWSTAENVDAGDANAAVRSTTSDATTSSTSTSYERAYASEEVLKEARVQQRRNERDAYVERERARRERREKCELVIIVEGGADVRTVRSRGGFTRERAKVLAIRHRGAFRRRPNADWEVRDERMDEIARLREKYDAPIVVLFDCDAAGRQLRNAFLKRFPEASHAFLGAHESSAKEDTKWHAVGNVGVEHGEGEDIARAIANARRADPTRSVFTRANLLEWGLVADDARADETWAEFGGVRERRRLVGEYLGVGECDSRQLIRQLNLFFTEDEVRDAMEALPKRGEPVPRKMTDGRADATRRQGDDDADSSEDEFDIDSLGFDPMAYIPPGRAPPGFE